MFEEALSSEPAISNWLFFRGQEFETFDWTSDARTLADQMAKIDCRAGLTQIGNVLQHASREHARRKVAGLVYVGDAMEEPEGMIFAIARELGLPAFLFQEGAISTQAGCSARLHG